MQVELSFEDAEMLQELLRQRIVELDKEIHRTDTGDVSPSSIRTVS